MVKINAQAATTEPLSVAYVPNGEHSPNTFLTYKLSTPETILSAVETGIVGGRELLEEERRSLRSMIGMLLSNPHYAQLPIRISKPQFLSRTRISNR